MSKLDIIGRLVKGLHAGSVLDVGCYNLRQYDAFRKAGITAAYTGVDVKSFGWENYRHDSSVRLFKQDITIFLKSNKQKFDVIIYSGMIDWLGNDSEMFSHDSFGTLKLLQAHMNPGSKLILTAVNNGLGRRMLNFLFGTMSKTRYMLDYDTINEDLKRLGYSIERSMYVPWETRSLEILRKAFFIGKWANNELMLICRKA